MVGVRYTICHWATNRTDPKNLLSTSLDVPLQSTGEEWYRLIGVRIEQGEDVNDFNIRTKELGCNY